MVGVIEGSLMFTFTKISFRASMPAQAYESVLETSNFHLN